MLCIDGDTHIAPFAEGGIGITAETLVARMDKAGVDRSLSWPYYPYDRRKLPEYCRYIYDSVQKFPDRITGFGWIDPMIGVDEAKALTQVCMADYGLRGIKLNGSQNMYRYDNMTLTAPLVEIVAKYNGIVGMHTGVDSPQRTHPYFGLKLALAYPETTFLMIHMGGVSYPDISDCAVEAAEQAPNILLVGSHVGDLAIMRAIARLGTKRVCFGSDAPFALTHVETAKYRAMLDELPPEDTADVMGGNLARLLSLQ